MKHKGNKINHHKSTQGDAMYMVGLEGRHFKFNFHGCTDSCTMASNSFP